MKDIIAYVLVVGIWLAFIAWAMFTFSAWFALLLIVPASAKLTL